MELIVGEEDLKFFNTLFTTLDKDNSGYLEKRELALAMKAADIKPTARTFLLNLVDEDENRKLDFKEFMFLMLISEENIKDVYSAMEEFNKFNKNDDTVLDRTETKELILTLEPNMNDEQFAQLYDAIDLDKSGKINKVEFYMIYRAITQPDVDDEEALFD